MKNIFIALFCCVALIGCNKSATSIDVKCRWVIYNTGQFNNNPSEKLWKEIWPKIRIEDPTTFIGSETIWLSTSYEDTVFNQGVISYNVFPPISNPIIVEHQIDIPSEDFDLYEMGHNSAYNLEGWSAGSGSASHFDYFYEKTYIEQNNQRIYTDTIFVGY